MLKGKGFLSLFTLNRLLHYTLVVAFFLTSFYSITASKYYSTLTATLRADTADAVVSIVKYSSDWTTPEDWDGSLTADNLQPGATLVINFKVCNYLPASMANIAVNRISEVAVDYTFNVKTAGLLPLTFTLNKRGQSENLITEAGATFDQASTFKIYSSVAGEFDCEEEQEDDYVLTITWPASENDGELLKIGGDYIKIVLDWSQKTPA